MSPRRFVAVTLLAAGPAAAAPPEAATLFGVWIPERDGRAVPQPRLTARAAAALEAREPAAGEAAPDEPAPCAPIGMPAILATEHPIELVERDDRVLIRFTELGIERTVYTDPRNGPARQDHSPLGVSFGRFEGGTLAVFTTYIDYPHFDRAGTPQSRDVTVLERYTASADGARLDWRITVTDPATFVAPVTWERPLTRADAAFTPEQPCGAGTAPHE